MHFVDHNILSNFYSLTSHGVKMELYNNQPSISSKSQAEPDVILDFQKSDFQESRMLALDQKTSMPGTGKSLIIPGISQRRFKRTLQYFSEDLIKKKYPLTSEMDLALEILGDNCLDFQAHLIYWAKIVHLFPSSHSHL